MQMFASGVHRGFHWANDEVDRSSPLHMAVWIEVSLSQVLIAELIGVMYMLHCVR